MTTRRRERHESKPKVGVEMEKYQSRGGSRTPWESTKGTHGLLCPVSCIVMQFSPRQRKRDVLFVFYPACPCWLGSTKEKKPPASIPGVINRKHQLGPAPHMWVDGKGSQSLRCLGWRGEVGIRTQAGRSEKGIRVLFCVPSLSSSFSSHLLSVSKSLLLSISKFYLSASSVL